MNAGKAVYGILSANSGVTDIVGTRIFPEIAEQEAVTPFVIYQLQSVAPEDTHDGPSKLDEVRFEFLCYADSYNAAADLGVAVRAALDRVSGTYNGVHVESVQFNDVDVEIEYDPRRYSQVLKFTFRIKRDDIEIALGTPVTGAQLDDLSDVNVSGVTDNQVLSYDAATDTWIPADDAGGAESLNDLTDVNITLPEDRNVLMYDGAEWVEDNVSKSDVGLGNVDNTSDADKPVSTATQTALDAKADTSAVPTTLNDLSDVTITGTPTGNQALIYDGTAGVFKSLPNFTNRFEDEAEMNKQSIVPFAERVYTVKSDGDGIFIDPDPDTPTAGKVIVRKIYHKAGFLESGAVIGDFTLIHTFADDTAYSATESTFEGFRDGDTYGTPPFTLIQTWEEQTAAPAFTGLLNETYGSGAAAAYSVRRLNGLYTGSAIQVERSSDNTYQDIGFDSNGDLDESALTTFCTGTTCKVRTWYDQSQSGGTGSGNDAVQTDHTKQPTIYTGGAIVKENGRVAVDFDGSSNIMDASLTIANDFTAIVTGLSTDTTSNQKFICDQTNSKGQLFVNSGNFNWFDGSSVTVLEAADTSRHLFFVSADTGGSFVSIDGADQSITGISNTGYGELKIGGRTISSQFLDGKMQEVILYPSDKSTDRTSIESNIGDYFTQNTPLLDTYTGAAAAYSLRKLRSAFSGSAIRVRRASDNTEQDIGFNVFGELDTVSLASFCSGTDGFVKVWYDQASTNDATQTATGSQPKIYDGTTGVVTEGTKPAINLDSNDFLDLGSLSAASGDNVSYYWVGDWLGEVSNNNRFVLHASETANLYIAPIGHQTSTVSGTAGLSSVTGYKDGVSVAVATRKNVHDAFRNVYHLGELYGTTTTAFSDTQLGRYPAGNNHYLNGNLQEFILYTSDQSSNRTNIEDNINTFYSIY